MGKWFIYMQLIAGFAVGVEILFDEDGGRSYGVQLGIFRVLFTKKRMAFVDEVDE